jgi:hypothetical protein
VATASHFWCEPLGYVSHAPLGLSFNGGLWLRWQLQNRGLLALTQCRQQHNAAVWKLQRIVMGRDLVFVDLPKDRRLILDCTVVVPRPQSSWQALNLVSEG